MTKKVANKKNKNILKIALVLLILLVIVLVIIKKDENEVSDKTTFIVSNQDITNNLENEIIIKDKIIYISFNDIKKYLDENIYQEEDLIITTSEKKVAKLELEEEEIVINGSTISIKGRPFKNEQNIIYLPISEMENVYDVEFSYNEKSNVITIDYYSKELIKAYVKKNVQVKAEQSKFSKIIEKVEKGNWLIYISEKNGWATVRTQNGKIGYVKYKNLTNFVTERENMESEPEDINEKEYLEKDITKKDISTYKEREKLINTILKDVVKKEYTAVKIKYEKESNEDLEKFKLEVKPILKECGIEVVFN